MFKLSLRLKLIMGILLSCVVFGLIFGYPAWAPCFLNAASPNRVRVQMSHPLATITIPKAQDLFTPFLLTVPLHTAVTWRNDDTLAHMVTTTAQQNPISVTIMNTRMVRVLLMGWWVKPFPWKLA